MKSFRHLWDVPSALPLPAEEITELHAGRMLALLLNCGIGTTSRIEGLTKLAKLDFFVRYPDAFNRMAQHLEKNIKAATHMIEAPMVRHHYGPWDKRYYQILAFLEARNLLTVSKKGSTFLFELSPEGRTIAARLCKESAFRAQIEQMKRVKKLLGAKSGSTIKRLIYEVFKEEIADRPLGKVIA